jgi:hypothetical protein
MVMDTVDVMEGDHVGSVAPTRKIYEKSPTLHNQHSAKRLIVSFTSLRMNQVDTIHSVFSAGDGSSIFPDRGGPYPH